MRGGRGWWPLQSQQRGCLGSSGGVEGVESGGVAEGVVGTGVEVKFRACAGQSRMKTTENQQARAAPWVRSSARLCVDGSSAAQPNAAQWHQPAAAWPAICSLLSPPVSSCLARCVTRHQSTAPRQASLDAAHESVICPPAWTAPADACLLAHGPPNALRRVWTAQSPHTSAEGMHAALANRFLAVS